MLKVMFSRMITPRTTSSACSISLQWAPILLSSFDELTSGKGADPTNGYVTYLDQSDAQNGGLINTNNGQVYMGVDSTNVASGSGRSSVRLSSTKSYNHGLIILDLAHMPGGICGTWPAL